MQEQSEQPTAADETTERWVIEPGQSRTITLEGVEALRVGVIAGHVDVVGHDTADTRIEILNVEGRPLEITLDAGKLQVAHPKVGWGKVLDSLKMLVGEKASADVSILVPRHVSLTYGQVSAEGLVSGLQNGASVSTVSGSVQLDSIAGAVECNTVSGDIAATCMNGVMQVHAVSGEIAVAGELATVGVDTVSGSVLLDIEGPVTSVAVNAVSAEATIRVDHDRTIDATLNTISGAPSVGGIALPKRGGQLVSQPDVASSGTVRVVLNSVSGDQTVVRRA